MAIHFHILFPVPGVPCDPSWWECPPAIVTQGREGGALISSCMRAFLFPANQGFGVEGNVPSVGGRGEALVIAHSINSSRRVRGWRERGSVKCDGGDVLEWRCERCPSPCSSGRLPERGQRRLTGREADSTELPTRLGCFFAAPPLSRPLSGCSS